MAKPDFVYTLIAYRPDGADSCRGYVYSRSSSELEVFVSKSAKDIAEIWAKCIKGELDGRHIAATEYQLLLNGHTPDSEPAYYDDDIEANEIGQTWYEAEREHVEALKRIALSR